MKIYIYIYICVCVGVRVCVCVCVCWSLIGKLLWEFQIAFFIFGSNLNNHSEYFGSVNKRFSDITYSEYFWELVIVSSLFKTNSYRTPVVLEFLVKKINLSRTTLIRLNLVLNRTLRYCTMFFPFSNSAGGFFNVGSRFENVLEYYLNLCKPCLSCYSIYIKKKKHLDKSAYTRVYQIYWKITNAI